MRTQPEALYLYGEHGEHGEHDLGIMGRRDEGVATNGDHFHFHPYKPPRLEVECVCKCS